MAPGAAVICVARADLESPIHDKNVACRAGGDCWAEGTGYHLSFWTSRDSIRTFSEVMGEAGLLPVVFTRRLPWELARRR
jgi:hypothetical protein